MHFFNKYNNINNLTFQLILTSNMQSMISLIESIWALILINMICLKYIIFYTLKKIQYSAFVLNVLLSFFLNLKQSVAIFSKQWFKIKMYLFFNFLTTWSINDNIHPQFIFVWREVESIEVIKIKNYSYKRICKYFYDII